MKSQSAMEYLMTYGWAILIIAIVLVAFFSLGLFNPYTFKPKASPGNCQIIRPNGPGTSSFVSLVGTCLNEIPQSVAQFNGQSSYINLRNPSALNFGFSDFSISVWIKLTNNSQFTVFEKRENNNKIIQLASSVSKVYVNYNYNNNYSYRVANTVLQTGTWYHIVGVINRTYGYPIIYLNGANDGYISQTVIGSPSTTTMDNAGNATIGRTMYSGIPHYINGSITNVQIYDIALTSNEVTTLYNEGIGGKPIDIQHIVGWWPLNGNAYDYSGNNNNGTTINVKFISNWETGYSSPS